MDANKPGSSAKQNDLMHLAVSLFAELTDAEKAMLSQSEYGPDFELGDSSPANAASNEIMKAEAWGGERRIRAELLRWVCSDGAAFLLIDPRGIRAENAYIDGVVDLSYRKIPFPLSLTGCRLRDPLNLNSAELIKLDLTDSWVASVNAEEATIKGSVQLKRIRSSGHRLTLKSAFIGGSLLCDGAHILNPARERAPESGVALSAEFATIKGALYLRNKFIAKGAVLLDFATIGTALDCDGGTFENPKEEMFPRTGIAISARGIRVAGPILMRSGENSEPRFSAKGAVLLYHAQIGGGIECTGARFENPMDDKLKQNTAAFNAPGINVPGDVKFEKSLVIGQVNLHNAHVGGNLICYGATFENLPREGALVCGPVLNLASAKIAGNVLLSNYDVKGRGMFVARGLVSLLGAQIGGALECIAGRFENPPQPGLRESGMAIQASNSIIGGHVLLRHSFSAQGRVNLHSARIGGNLECDGGTFENPPIDKIPGSGTALSAKSVRVTGSLSMRSDLQMGKFRANGAVDVTNARIDGALEIDGGTFTALDLRDCSARALADDVDKLDWQATSQMNLDGFTYERISQRALHDLAKDGGIVPHTREAVNISNRLKWLQLQVAFTRQPYLNLAKVLKASGDDKNSRRVSMAMESRARVGKGLLARGGGYVLNSTIGYGYASQRAIYWISGIILLGTLIFWHGFAKMVPSQAEAYQHLQKTHDTPISYGRFHALAYSIDNSFPLIKLGAQEKWIPNETSKGDNSPWLFVPAWANRFITSPVFLRTVRYVQVCTGWMLTTLFAVGISGIIRKD